jgi:hypothetical protein
MGKPTAAHAQQTEDDVYVGKSKTFGNYRGTDIGDSKSIKGQTTLSGTVVKVDWCEEDCYTMLVKKADGTMITVGTKDYGFTIPKSIVGKKIIIEGIEPAKRIVDKKTVKKTYQTNIQFAASGVRQL